MKKSERLTPVAEIAHDREGDAARRLAECRRAVEEKQRRLDELEAYHKEYLEQFRRMTALGSPVATVQRYRLFMNKLDAIIVQQREIVEAGRRQCEEQYKQWSTHRRKAKAMDKVIERHVLRERHAADRLEQIEADELVGRGKRRRDEGT